MSRQAENRSGRAGPWRRGKGFSLVEVLVSMLVVSMGVLALAGLLQVASRSGKAAQLDAVATLLANDLADRIRANPAGAALGAQGYDLGNGTWPETAASAHPACTRVAPCAPGDVAQADVAAWAARVRAMLPDGSGRVAFHVGAPPARAAVDVWVGWSDAGRFPAGLPADCPAGWHRAAVTVRCVYLQVGL